MSRTAPGFALVVVLPLALGCGAAGQKDDVATGCDPGWHACGPGPDDCAPDTSPLTCGTRCTPCPSPPSGIATCVAGACGFTCETGYHACAGLCVDDGSKDACGTACEVCPTPAYEHSSAACVKGPGSSGYACGYSCDLGYLKCASGCCTAPRGALARLACGGIHTCGVTRDGTAKCWGGNGNGQLGDDSLVDRHVPVPVAGSSAGTAAQVTAAWDHSCGVDPAGGAWCWGSGWAGQLGDGSWGMGNVKQAPVQVSLPGAVALTAAAGWAHSCALLAGGAVKCWGNNDRGQLGTGLAGGANLPVPVDLGTESFGLLSGWNFACAVTGPASMACWGDNASGQLGNPASDDLERLPVAVPNIGDVTSLRAVALGNDHTCVAYDKPGVSGAVRCWGSGEQGQLGHGLTPEVQRTGVEVLELATGDPLLDVVSLAAGAAHTCAVTGAGALLCWGSNQGGQLGVGAPYTLRSTAAAVGSLASGVSGVAAGNAHSCALVDAGTATEKLWCWGQNGQGQVGDDTIWTRPTPVEITGF